MQTETVILLFTVWLGHLTARTHSVRPAVGQRSPLCDRVSGKPETRFPPETAPGSGSVAHLNCSLQGFLARMEVGKQHGHYRVMIHTCPNVTQYVVRVTGPARFSPEVVTSKLQPIKCHKKRDTVVVTRPHRHQTFWVMSSRPAIKKDIGLIWSYQLPSHGAAQQWSQKEYVTVQSSASRDRAKRSTGVSKQETKVIKLQQLQECGVRKSCVRFGTKGCNHLECDYLLSYSISNHTFLELEISGKSDGWVALGLSSDDKMGGDGVIVCKLKSALRTDLEALSMKMAVPYSRPSPQPNDITLVDQRVQDGHLYCKITKDLEKDDGQNSGTGLDLTNNWFQFYGKGKIDRNGIMLKHSETPPTSVDTISMLRPQKVESLEYKQLSNRASSKHLLPPWQTIVCVALLRLPGLPL